jgi:hypothetical protein
MASYPQKSRTTNLLELFEKVTSSTDGDGAADVAFMDFAKPWIRYKGVLKNRRSHGVMERLLKRIANRLNQRQQSSLKRN